MAVESKKNETSAEKNVNSEASKGEEFVKINGEGKPHRGIAILPSHAWLRNVICIEMLVSIISFNRFKMSIT